MASILLERNEAAYGGERTILFLGNGACMLQHNRMGMDPTVKVFLLFFIHECNSKAIDDHDISLLNQKKTRQIRKD